MVKQRFYTLTEVGEILNISLAQARAIVRSGELPAIQIGGRGQWRVEDVKLEEYIAQAYKKTEQAIEHHQIASSF
ncbi:helix-turn-helix domain-containing protein [Rothia sp. P6271]|uniref:helix-turn-helix domain-containing protein n=1 Tax=unclassified Rothia (in: high G+C Gram-positive bacteria) TaxID=2689056 RepID=UPI003AC12582